AGGLLLIIAFAPFIIRAITRPLAGMTSAMARLAAGDTSLPVPALDRADEIGAMAKAVQVFKDNMIRSSALEAEQAKDQAARAARATKIETLTHGFEADISTVVKMVSSAAHEMQTTAT